MLLLVIVGLVPSFLLFLLSLALESLLTEDELLGLLGGGLCKGGPLNYELVHAATTTRACQLTVWLGR